MSALNIISKTRPVDTLTQHTRFQVFTSRQLEQIPQLARLDAEQRFAMKVVASVLPFRVNQYVLNELIDWDNVPADPIYQLVFPQRDMLEPADFDRMADLIRREAEPAEIQAAAREIQAGLNPHPAGQQELNVPHLDGAPLEGMQHKYRETVLFFPSQGQVCHSYCTFCFRWAQFVGDKELRFASNEADTLHAYLANDRNITDLLITGGDPMVMKTRHLAGYLEAFLEPRLEHVQTIRIGTKSLTFWPQRFVTDADADEVLRLFERLSASGKHVALMAHVNHWQELETPIAREAIRRIRDTGAVIRTQAPLLNHINNDPEVWATMWRTQVRLGLIPYYMFVERDTGAKRYFKVPLARAYDVYRQAIQQVSGLARTARGPSMSAGPGKVEVQGITELQGEKVFVLRFIQGRNADWVQQPFFARFDPHASWLDELQPAFGESEFFFSKEYAAMGQQDGELII
jgi:KamA family protein